MATIEEPKFKKHIVIDPKVTRRVKLIDKLANWMIKSGGTLVILVVALILIFIGKECVPLFLPGKSQEKLQVDLTQFASPNTPLIMGVDEYETYTYFVSRETAQLDLYNLQTGAFFEKRSFEKLAGKKVSSGYRTPSNDYLFLGTVDGYVLLAKMNFPADVSGEGRVVRAELKEYGLIALPERTAVKTVYGRVNAFGEMVFAVITEDNKVYYGTKTLDAMEMAEQAQGLIEGELASRIGEGAQDAADVEAFRAAESLTVNLERVLIDFNAEKLFVLGADNVLYHFYLDGNPQEPFKKYSGFVNPATGQERTITALELLIGDVTLLLGYHDGSSEAWFGIRDEDSETFKPYRPIHRFESIGAAVTQIVPSARNRAFISAGENGNMFLYYVTSAKTLIRDNVGGPVALAAYAPKLTLMSALTQAGKLKSFGLEVHHPDVSLQMLFGKIWYEGYDQPIYNWQSTAGSDDFEPKFSLVPLTLGTVKGAFYGLLFAIPIAVLGALYTSQFLSPHIKTYVKPTIEIMAALPSVVIGFLAGLWLAPLLQDKLVMIVLAPFVLGGGAILTSMIWSKLPVSTRTKIPHGYEIIFILPLFLALAYLTYLAGVWIDFAFFNGDIRQWIFNQVGVQVEQRNSIVIGLAMGFAVIPIIFTISEDAFTNVPKAFTSASYALGASRWQTAFRVILPTASPGVFSAVMIGFGRAVGETMIVLMATGNTPIMSFSPFNGMRTLSANIAVEIPEAAVGDTHYRILFVAALLLFVLTFVVNTVAEIIRQRLRDKYKAV
ncbi:ABC transporter permease subunit [Oscillatoria laete-virens NRMC-F 0139]|nr:ABC transporter permease subunit [Oscillatoria laete-virens]MDL5054717.1 ABC transporter permease subunit [Oscillatoria laete-virens NRMC-F 0139]